MVKDNLPTDATRTPKVRASPGRSTLASDMGEFEWNIVGDRFVISERMAAITGLAAGPMRAQGGRAALDYIYPDDVSTLESRYKAALAAGDRHEARFRLMRPDTGELIWVGLSAVLIRGRGGGVEKVIGVVRDISKLKAEEDEVAALLSELDHRVKNVLECVRSIAAQSARRSANLESFTKIFNERLGAMSSAHTLLTHMRRRGAGIDYIIDAELAGLAFGRAQRNGPAIVMTPPATSALTFAVHELTANSVKFGICGMWAPMTGPRATNTPATTAPERRLTPDRVTPTKMAILNRKLNCAAPTLVLSPP